MPTQAVAAFLDKREAEGEIKDEIATTTAPRLRAVRGTRRRRLQPGREVMERIAGGTPPNGLGRKDLDCWESVLGHALNVYEAILATQAAQALEGDLKAAQFVRDTLGDKPGTSAGKEPEGLSNAERALVKKVAARLDVHNPAAEL